MEAYPLELRTRVVSAVKQGEHSLSEIAALFNVGKTFVKKMMRLDRGGEDLSPRHGGGPPTVLEGPDEEVLREEVKKHPDATLEELQDVMLKKRKVSVSPPTLSRVLRRLNLPRKKRVSSQPSAAKRRACCFKA